jgi:LPS-assembly lipoprotein
MNGQSATGHFLRWLGAGASLALALVLCSCGFRPLYGSFSSAPGTIATFRTIYVQPIPERVGYELRNSLIDLLDASGSPVGARYYLVIIYREKIIPVAVQNQSVPISAGKTVNEVITTRYNYRLVADYRLTTPKGVLVTKGSEDSLADYNVTASAAGTFATEAAKLDAQNAAADDIANHLKLDLAMWFASHPGAAP